MMSRCRVYKYCSWITGASLLLEFLLIIASWIISSAFPESSVRSLLSNEGIRWLFGHYVSNIQTSILVWMLLISMSIGLVKHSELCLLIRKCFMSVKSLNYRERIGGTIVVFEVLFSLALLTLLTCVPHAILLSISGELFPSSFSMSIVPIVSFLLILMGATYGLVIGRLNSLESWFISMQHGISIMAPLFVVYVFLTQLILSFCYVLEIG